MIFALIFAFAVILGKNTKLANVACQWNVSKTQTGDGIKSSVAAALIETCTEYEIEFLDAEHSENLIIQKDYETVIKLSGRDTNGGALDQTVYKPVSQGMIVVNNSIDIRRGIVTIENIEFQFIYQTEYQKTLPEYAAINVYNDKDSYGSNPYPKVTLTHCNFKGFGVTARGVHRSLCVNHAISILIDECSFTDMSGTSSLLFSRVDSVIVRNCLFQDISSSNAIQVSNDSRALNIEITDNTFRRISGTDLGNIQIKIFESTTQKSLKINGNIIDSCSHSRSGGIYLEYSEFGTIELKDNQFINNSFTSTTTTNGNGADAFIYKKQQYGSSTSDGAEILQPLFEGSTSTQFESVVYSLIPYGSGSSNIYGNFSLDVICPDGQPAEPLPLGCGCKPDKTVDECACQFGDLRQVCACDAIGDKRVHCVGVTTPCKEASKTQLNQLTTDVCDCLPVGDPRNALCADSKQCSEATKLQLQELNTDICPCIPVGDPRTSVCTSSRACESATSAQLASVSSDICPCLIRQDPRPEECPPAIPCKQVVSDDTTISGTKSSVAAALSETCIDYDISLLDAEHSENLIIQEDYQTVIKLSGRDTNGGALEQTVYKAVPSQSSYVLIGIDIRRGNITIENIDFQFVEQYDKVAPLTAFISVYNSAADYYSFQHPRPNVTITHCNFKGLGANGKVVGRSLNVYEAVHIVIDGCSFTDMKVGTVVQLTEQRSAIVKNSLFQDLQVSNAINVPDNVITSNVEINDSSFIRVSGTDYGTIKIIIQSSGLQFKVRFNRNIVDSCSNTQTGGIYLQLLNYQTIQFSDNTFISNQYTITSNPSTYPPLGADAVIWKRSDDYYLPTGETYFKRAFAGSASDQSNSVGFYLESTRTGGDKFIGQFSIDSFCTGGTPTVPLPEGCKCKPDKTAQQCACQIGDTRNECVCDVIGDQRTHCVGKTKTCNEASSTELAQVSEDICECIPVGDLRSECQQETTPCSKTSKQDLTNLPINICECQPVGDPRSQCSQSKLCNNPSADLTNIPVSRCPCLSTGDGRAGKSEEGFSCPDYCEKGAATEDCTCDTAKDGYTLSECQQEKECKFNLAQQTKEYCPCLPTQDPRSDKCQYCQKRSATEDCICDTDLPGYTLSECQQEKECKYNLASQTKEDCPCLDTGDPREGNGQCPAYCKKGSIEEDCKCDTNAQGYTVADCEEDKIYPRLDYCKETDVQQVEPNTCKCNYEFSPLVRNGCKEI
ncbi:MAG: hypothetical protein EZS28_007433 [Streblomastix strix]|uniref:Right handed beta helix domain-containing protein n=1 Tax=Streblomastix strix TaxID=222440 RepID=A0A5J4WPI2_9EUKA|nr:MAG: hypothetical protein EZS28_007433 [Streblomastix strix]